MIILIKKVFFNNEENLTSFSLILISYVGFSLLYLVLYGPIPRYTIGILCTIILFIGFYTKEPKLNINKSIMYILFLISIGLLPRLNSYSSFLENKNIALFDPRTENNVPVIISDIEWEEPEEADRCWININCRFEDNELSLTKGKIFYKAFIK